MADKDQRTKWWGVAKAVAYELRPFTLPSQDDVKMGAEAARTNAQQLWAEAKRLGPEVWKFAKGLKLLNMLMVFSWLCGWKGFSWLGFGKCRAARENK